MLKLLLVYGASILRWASGITMTGCGSCRAQLFMTRPIKTYFAMLLLPIILAGCSGSRIVENTRTGTAAGAAASGAIRAAAPLIPDDLLGGKYVALQPLVTKVSDGNDTYRARFPKAAEGDSSGASTALACVAAYMAAERSRPRFSLLGGFSRDEAGLFTALFSLDERDAVIDPREVEVTSSGNACSNVVLPKYRWN